MEMLPIVLFCCLSSDLGLDMAQELVMKIMTMSDDKTKKKSMEAAADILGVNSIAVDLNEQTLTVIGEMDIVAMVKKVKKSMGHVEILSFGPVSNKEESK